MIIQFDIDCKNYEKLIMNEYQIYNYTCPKCLAKSDWVRHAIYERNVVLVEIIAFIEVKMKILRLKCKSCNSTHAILPSDIIPYCIYSLPFIFAIISEYYLEEDSVLCIAKEYKISFQVIYNYLKLFESFINECISTLRILEIIKGISIAATKEIFKLIVDNFENNSFVKKYAQINKWPFLMKKFRNIYHIPIYIGFANL
ncbi:MAG: hypothetical protein COA82_10265 [Alkaliphilus sp.]|nr:hypothetical protein [bacterium AH-315-L21]MBN4063118.1 hypothetical protein [Alkaliphilus sp. AH-315-G20]MBN4067834.1 hypothetical protein [Alkaliphilus transvaalensis]MBN4069756.1 hypothetical protein [bacterium AH-315-G05]PHS31356.1 MAG: hypothetical protein COA82_10265 [Alkaliphilus sp.]